MGCFHPKNEGRQFARYVSLTMSPESAGTRSWRFLRIWQDHLWQASPLTRAWLLLYLYPQLSLALKKTTLFRIIVNVTYAGVAQSWSLTALERMNRLDCVSPAVNGYGDVFAVLSVAQQTAGCRVDYTDIPRLPIRRMSFTTFFAMLPVALNCFCFSSAYRVTARIG